MISANKARSVAENYDIRTSPPYLHLVEHMEERVILAASQGNFGAIIEVPMEATDETVNVFIKDLKGEGYNIKNIHKMDDIHEIFITW